MTNTSTSPGFEMPLPSLFLILLSTLLVLLSCHWIINRKLLRQYCSSFYAKVTLHTFELHPKTKQPFFLLSFRSSPFPIAPSHHWHSCAQHHIKTSSVIASLSLSCMMGLRDYLYIKIRVFLHTTRFSTSNSCLWVYGFSMSKNKLLSHWTGCQFRHCCLGWSKYWKHHYIG